LALTIRPNYVGEPKANERCDATRHNLALSESDGVTISEKTKDSFIFIYNADGVELWVTGQTEEPGTNVGYPQIHACFVGVDNFYTLFIHRSKRYLP